MDIITLRDIRRIAEQESVRHFHYYIGVEHLFIAMTKLKNGITNAVLDHMGIEPRFIRYRIRQEIGVNEDGRYWSGFRDTPRAKIVLETAEKYAELNTPTEQQLLLAILDEADSIPIRILLENHVDIQTFRREVANWSSQQSVEMPPVQIEGNFPLTEDEEKVIQRMFRKYGLVRIEQELNGGYTGARILVITPKHAGRFEASVVVKISERSVILEEQTHYEKYVKDIFPVTTPHLMDNPTLPDGCDYGGLKYSLVLPPDSKAPQNLREVAEFISPIELGHLLRDNVFKIYAPAMWLERQRYRFGIWREYEHVLPPALEVEFLDLKQQGTGTVLEPLGSWSRQNVIRIGQLVSLRNFVVQKVRHKQGSIQLAAGGGSEAVNHASKIEIVGLGKMVYKFRRGEVVDLLVGQVKRRRIDILLEYTNLLEFPFDLQELDTLTEIPYLDEIPNPLHYVSDFLDRQVRGYMSIIHGDLHLGNILIGPSRDAWLIDFALVREGHCLFDWATLEVSLMVSIVAPRLQSWDDIWLALKLLNMINNLQYHMNWDNSPIAEALRTITQIRETVQENLAKTSKWQEYHIALMMLALRGLSWTETTSVQARRLLFGVAALSVMTTFRADAGKLSSAGTREAPTDTQRRISRDLTSPEHIDDEEEEED